MPTYKTLEDKQAEADAAAAQQQLQQQQPGWRAKPGRSAAGTGSSSGAEQPVSTPAARLGVLVSGCGRREPACQ